MIRIVCPHCHAPLSTAELEPATLAGSSCLCCPDSASVLVKDIPDAESHVLAEHNAVVDSTHA